jgi:NitT/TauT family transport system ATP-binding protein
MMSDTIVAVHELCKSFKNDAKEEIVLNKLSFTITRGEFFGIIGHSGCGKSTLLRILCGFESRDTGSVLINGREVLHPSREALMMFQDFGQLLPWRTVLGNLVYPLMATKTIVDRKQAMNIAYSFLQDVGLKDHATIYPHQLSGGMKQRVALARALALKPKVLLMDEPFSALDDFNRQKMQILTQNICRKYGVTVVFVTHSINEAILLADHILIFDLDNRTQIMQNSGSMIRERLESLI